MQIKIISAVLLLFQLFAQGASVVTKYGQLSVKGTYLVATSGDTVQLSGMSLFWSQWMPQYYTKETVNTLVRDWRCTVIRAAMGVDMGGYATNPLVEKEKIVAVVDAAIETGIYVIIDFHSHEAHKNPELAKQFFSEMAKRYGKYPNVLYEIYNEPLQDGWWSSKIKPYAEQVIAAIREHDPDNIVIVGTRMWSQMVSEVAEDRLTDKNTVYALHFYAASHGANLRAEAKKALDKGVPIFVSEFGTCESNGDGKLGIQETREWLDFMDQYKLSWCNWSVANKVETASVLKPDAADFDWDENELTPSGIFIRNELRKRNK